MPRTVRRRRRLPAGGYREHRLAIWGVTGCVAVAAGVALTAGLAAASPQLGNLPGGTTDRRPALAGLPTVDPSGTGALGFGLRMSGSPSAGPSPSPQQNNESPDASKSPQPNDPSPSPSQNPTPTQTPAPNHSPKPSHSPRH